MSDTDNEKESDRLSGLNDELNASLERCRDLLKTCRSKLAANANDPGTPEDDGESCEA